MPAASGDGVHRRRGDGTGRDRRTRRGSGTCSTPRTARCTAPSRTAGIGSGAARSTSPVYRPPTLVAPPAGCGAAAGQPGAEPGYRPVRLGTGLLRRARAGRPVRLRCVRRDRSGGVGAADRLGLAAGGRHRIADRADRWCRPGGCWSEHSAPTPSSSPAIVVGHASAGQRLTLVGRGDPRVAGVAVPAPGRGTRPPLLSGGAVRAGHLRSADLAGAVGGRGADRRGHHRRVGGDDVSACAPARCDRGQPARLVGDRSAHRGRQPARPGARLRGRRSHPGPHAGARTRRRRLQGRQRPARPPHRRRRPGPAGAHPHRGQSTGLDRRPHRRGRVRRSSPPATTTAPPNGSGAPPPCCRSRCR